ncbi:MAG: methyl-accepting chemotaxis protein [Janthinobacterium lividum]
MTTKATSIGARLAIGYGAVLLLMLALTALAVIRVGQIDSLLAGVEDVARAKQRYAMDMRSSVRDRAIALRDVVLAPDAAAAAAPIGRIKTLNDNYARAASPLHALLHELPQVAQAEKEALAAIREQERRTRPLLDRVIALHAAGQGQEAAMLLSQQAGPAFTDWMASIARFVDLEEKLAVDGMGAARQLASGFPAWLVLLCMATVAVALPGAWFIARALARATPAPAAGAAAEAPAAPAAAPCVSEIVSAIDGIAFQANILALDAALEAVRSGAQEGGTAAEEARALAARASSVARDIRALLASPAVQAEDAGALAAFADAAARVTAVMLAIAPGAGPLQAPPVSEAARRETALLRAASAATALEEGARRLTRALDLSVPVPAPQG